MFLSTWSPQKRQKQIHTKRYRFKTVINIINTPVLCTIYRSNLVLSKVVQAVNKMGCIFRFYISGFTDIPFTVSGSFIWKRTKDFQEEIPIMLRVALTLQYHHRYCIGCIIAYPQFGLYSSMKGSGNFNRFTIALKTNSINIPSLVGNSIKNILLYTSRG